MLVTSQMAKPRAKRPDGELRALSHHLLYEIEMFAFTTDHLRARRRNRSERCGTLYWSRGCFHVRNLLSFIYDDDRARSDDAIAAELPRPGLADESEALSLA
jgi:hypothetical protein